MSVPRPWYKHPGRTAGIAIAGYFAVKLLILLHLGLLGRVVPGFSGRLSPGEAVEAGAQVLYFYQVGDANYHGWRRGLDYGGQRLSVVYSPIVAGLHVASLRDDLTSAWALWTEPDFWLRLLLAAAGLGLGVFVERLWARFERAGGEFLAGLTRGGYP